jgi:predicted AlkP superfamily pyrophosphatase or phosphodiesterase
MKDSVFVTSTYYSQALPSWVRTFNASGKINSYFNSVWEKSLPPRAYEEVDRDDAPYEDGGSGLGLTFPHIIRGEDPRIISRSYYPALLSSPFGAEMLADLAKQAIVGEQLGQRGVPDLLCVSFSSTDYVGHAFGPHSQEVLDMCVRMDRILAGFFDFLGQKFGLSHCLIVLTSDHGVSPIPQYLQAHTSAPVINRFTSNAIAAVVESVLTARFPQTQKTKWIENYSGGSLFLSERALAAAGVSVENAGRAVCEALRLRPEVACAFTREEIRTLNTGSLLERRMRNSDHETRSGDVVLAFRPLWIEGEEEPGASHGSPLEWDAHVPLLIRGPGTVSGVFYGEASPADIAPTLSALTGVEFTPANEGRVLVEAIGTGTTGKRDH